MIFVNVHNGLGNQLFHYAAGRRLAIETGQRLALDAERSPRQPHEHFQLDQFVLGPHLRSRLLVASLKRIIRPALMEDWTLGRVSADFYRRRKHTYLVGNFQSLDYVDPILGLLRAELQLKANVLSALERLYAKEFALSARPDATVAHVRLGDYVRHNYNILGAHYYREAIRAVSADAPDGPVVVCSDTPELARALLHDLPGLHFIHPGNRPAPHLACWEMMRRSARLVISNSTFSLWAAVLSRHTNIAYPEYWYQGDARTTEQCRLCRPGWRCVPLAESPRS